MIRHDLYESVISEIRKITACECVQRVLVKFARKRERSALIAMQIRFSRRELARANVRV